MSSRGNPKHRDLHLTSGTPGHTVGMDAGRGDETIDPTVMPRVGELVDRFLTDRNDRTSQAYSIDLDDFATFLGATRAGAATRLLAGGPNAAWHLVLEYAIDLRRRDRAPTTIDRRLNTLRALVRDAGQLGIVEWQLRLASEDEIMSAMEKLPANDSGHYLLPRHLDEIDRLDIQHYTTRETLRANHLAPVVNPGRVLDVGCGT